MSEDDRVKQWQSEAVEMNFKTWLMLKLDNAEARATELADQVEKLMNDNPDIVFAMLRAERDQLAAQVEQLTRERDTLKYDNTKLEAVIRGLSQRLNEALK